MPDEEPKHKKTLICQGCGKEIEWRAKRKYCTKCSVKKHDVDRKNWIKKIGAKQNQTTKVWSYANVLYVVNCIRLK